MKTDKSFDELVQTADEQIKAIRDGLKGGPGSGNFGHGGRPGQVGGSSSGGGKAGVVSALQGLGGNLWEKGGKSRVYFDVENIATQGGMKYEAYGTGNIRWAKFDGDKISNSEAKRALSALRAASIYFDLSDNTLQIRDQYDRLRESRTARDIIDNFRDIVSDAVSKAE